MTALGQKHPNHKKPADTHPWKRRIVNTDTYRVPQPGVDFTAGSERLMGGQPHCGADRFITSIGGAE